MIRKYISERLVDESLAIVAEKSRDKETCRKYEPRSDI